MMKIGLLAFVADYTADPASVAGKCEALGFESIFIPEHPIIPAASRLRCSSWPTRWTCAA